jgi:hypothetical protein
MLETRLRGHHPIERVCMLGLLKGEQIDTFLPRVDGIWKG